MGNRCVSRIRCTCVQSTPKATVTSPNYPADQEMRDEGEREKEPKQNTTATPKGIKPN